MVCHCCRERFLVAKHVIEPSRKKRTSRLGTLQLSRSRRCSLGTRRSAMPTLRSRPGEKRWHMVAPEIRVMVPTAHTAHRGGDDSGLGCLRWEFVKCRFVTLRRNLSHGSARLDWSLPAEWFVQLCGCQKKWSPNHKLRCHMIILTRSMPDFGGALLARHQTRFAGK